MLQKLNKPNRGFTLIEIMIVVAIIALLAAIAVPNFLRARKRSQATRILQDLRVIDSAIDQYAIDTNRASGDSVYWTDIQKYLKQGSVLYNSGGKDMFGHEFVGMSAQGVQVTTGWTVDGSPNAYLHHDSFGLLSDVAPSDFWSPFYLH
jgi:prepilin-type N-terminal cleavage/methylation domain-containing protein